jgi:hypothetical protein
MLSLNKMPLLDKGFMTVLSVHNDGPTLQAIQEEFFKASIEKSLTHLSNVTFVVKCPLFVQLNMSKFNFKIISVPSPDVEAFVPNEGDISAPTHVDAQNIKTYFEQTTEALLLNSRGLPMDGCDKFIAQVLTPISTYTTIIVHGSLHNWLDYINQKRLPNSLEVYRALAHECLKAYFPNIDIIRFSSNRG